jgi:hypothetical protein
MTNLTTPLLRHKEKQLQNISFSKAVRGFGLFGCLSPRKLDSASVYVD